MLDDNDLVRIKRMVEETIDNKMEKIVDPLVREIDSMKDKLGEVENKIKYLPTADMFMQNTDKLYGELLKIRDIQLGYTDKIEEQEQRIVELESGNSNQT